LYYPSSSWGSVIQNLEEGVVTFNPAMETINANKSALKLLGSDSLADLESIAELIIKPEIKGLVLSGVEVLNVPVRWNVDEKEENYLCSYIPVIPEGGVEVHGLIVLIKPGLVSSVPPVESWLEWGRHYINQVISNLREGVCYLDAQGRIIYANHTFKEMSGGGFEDISGKHVASVLKPTCRPLFLMEAVEKTVKEGSWQGEFEVQTGGGRRVLLATSAKISSEEGKDLGIAIFARDITERKWLENEMQSRNQELSLVYDLLHLTTAYQDLENGLKQLLARILSIVRAEAGVIYVCDRNTYEPQLVTYQGLTYQSARALASGKEGKPLTKKVMQSARGLIINREQGESQSLLSGRRGALLSLAAVPISSMSRDAGVLMVGHKESGHFGDKELRVLLSLASQIGIVFELAGLVDDLQSRLEELGQERDFSRALVDSMPSALALLDNRARVVYTNQRFSELLGYSLKEVENISFNSLIVPGERKRIMGDIMTRERSRGVWADASLVDKWGDTLAVLLTSTPRPFESGGYSGAIVTITDVSEQRAREREAQEIGETAKGLSRELAGARDSRQLLDSRKEAYLSMVHYEVTRPLRNAREEIGNLEKGIADIPSGEVRSRLKRLGRTLRRLERLAGDIQDATGMEKGRLRLRRRELDLCDMTSRVIDDLSVSQGRNISLDLPDKAIIGRADKMRMEQALMCVLDYAAEYSPPGPGVKVTLKRQENQAHWEIENGSEGPSPPAIESNESLSLLICRHIIEAHGGSMRLESSAGRSATCFSVPL